MELKTGDKVMFSNSVIKRVMHDKRTADMRGIITDIKCNGKVAMVETNGSFISEEGNSLRGIPVANLVRVMI